MDRQRVMLIHDASAELSVGALRSILDGFSLKHGDVLTILSIINRINHRMKRPNDRPMAFYFVAGYRIKVDDSMSREDQKAIDDEVARKKKECRDNLGFVQISKLYEMQKILLKIEFGIGPVSKNVTLEEVKKSSPTWVILDRRMKKDKKYFLEKLVCGVSKMKSNDNIVKIRGPILLASEKPKACGLRQISYKKMLSGPVDDTILSTKRQNDEDMFSIKATSSSTSTRTSVSEPRLTTLNYNTEEKIKKAINELSMLLEAYTNENHQNYPKRSTSFQVQLPFVDPKVCSSCNNTGSMTSRQIRKFSYLELVDATNIFSSENLIHQSEHEIIFRGTLKSSKQDVMVKEHKDLWRYKSEMHVLDRTCNENVVMLLGTCSEYGSRLLVFKEACNGSLHQHLSEQNKTPLSWDNRLKIAVGASRGLYHLHQNEIIHCDVHPKNVLLTHHFEPLIAGFGLTRTKTELLNSSNHLITGTFGYLAPEYIKQGKITIKADVYAFGMVLLELITGRSITDARLKGQSLLKWARTLIKEKKFYELMDPAISYDNHQFMEILQLTINCLCKDPHMRLSMNEVVSKLRWIKDEKSIHETQDFVH
ncbi:hypothetical protein OSB04_009350, partial [Centaurea solstitialis]